MKGQGVIDSRHIFEVDGVWDSQTLHSIGVPPLLEMHLKSSTAPITIVSADFAFVLDSESVQFVQPIRDGFAVPTQGQVLWVVHRFIRIDLTLRLYLRAFFLLLVASGLFLSDEVHCVVKHAR